MYFHHNTIRKYTLALLSTFNNLEVEKILSTGVKDYTKAPIRFSSREKAVILSEYETSEILNGNYNIIPRISLVFNSMQKASERSTSKFNTINRSQKTVDGVQKASYQYNAVPYDFSYSLVILADGMSEASMIAEQIAAYFNPTYNLKINEIPLQVEPATIPLLLNDISFETQEYDEFSSNIVTIQVELLVKGNIYPPIRDQHLIEQILIFNNKWEDDEYDRVSKITWEKQIDGTFSSELESFVGREGKITPVITALTGPSSVVGNGVYEYTLGWNDSDAKFSEQIFLYNIITLNGEIPSDIAIIENNKDKIVLRVKPTTPLHFRIQCQVVDIFGNSSEAFYKEINV